MSDRKETLREEIQRRRREIEESTQRSGDEESKIVLRGSGKAVYSAYDYARIQPPEPWPDPPEDEGKNNKDKR
uniref:Uncharacterized protein n=1 Tax=Candidatus Kentrum sp. MB TaxID=2138164 RepID=A0A451BAN7_9GAMM|nr:MAG: hypothetical protein BECKMB1821G_GA0114241_100855 [Candidatus Kentron sp. MB]VFK30714.1 MAG: hypothetical protein BECKMB1821I_GA0114274_101730 [Candidatus Kentron sp. MB]VFK75337.1 MAG: hypothetical protein BECKMB1821H_GA0114242_102012 [Candidatus Kentron sp. MB]